MPRHGRLAERRGFAHPARTSHVLRKLIETQAALAGHKLNVDLEIASISVHSSTWCRAVTAVRRADALRALSKCLGRSVCLPRLRTLVEPPASPARLPGSVRAQAGDAPLSKARLSKACSRELIVS
ncbi:MAG: hypothetical protein M5R42_01620 [Rhodocyclaceae bacterium]|nr:hypothetical protein [Rhodocyclaceae bacterium]